MTDIPMLDLTRRAAKDMYGVWRQFMGIPQTGDVVPSTLREFGRQPADEAWVFTCMTIRADNVAGVPLCVEVKDGSGWVPLEGKADSAGEDLQFLLHDVNPAWEGSSLQSFTDAGASIHGGSYWKKVRGRLGGPPQELYWLSGADIEPRFDGTAPFPSHYEYRPEGASDKQDIPARDIIAFRDVPNVQRPYHLLSPLSAVRYEVATNRRATEWNASILANWGIPPGAWLADKDAEMAPGDLSAIKRALAALRGTGSQGKTPVLPGGIKWQPLALGQKDADWIASRKVSRMAVCAAIGVPLVLAGDDEKAGVYASVRDAERVMWRLRIIPALDKRASRLDSWLVPDFDRTRKRLRVRYDYSGIEALRAAPAEEATSWQGWVDRGLPLNRAIAHFGLGQPVEGGEESRFKEQPQEGQPRPAEYQTVSETGASSPKEPRKAAAVVRGLGRSLYRDEAIKGYLSSGDEGWLDSLGITDPADRARLGTGLKRRYSVDQLLSGVPGESFVGLDEE